MDTEKSSSPVDNQNFLSVSLPETNFQQSQQKKEGLATKLRQTINAAGKRVQTARHRKSSLPNLVNLTPESQEFILQTVEKIKNEDSQNLMTVLDESRDMLRMSLDEFRYEQNEYRKQLEDIMRMKEAAMQRRKENAIPLSMFLRQKRDVERLADLRPNSGMNPTYQAYFEALLTPNQNEQQHPSDKAAVIKYIRRRERRKRAEENRKTHQLSDDILEKQTTEIMEKIDGMDVKLERERQRQNDLLRNKVNEKKVKTKTMIEAGEILGQAHEATLARQRVDEKQREKIEARLNEVRSRTPTNMIYVQSPHDENSQLNTEQRSATQHSLQLLNESDNNKAIRPVTPIYGDEKDSTDQIANIDI